MTPKEKAKEFVFKKFGCSKRYALIAVDEISKHCYEVMKPFWEEVKDEILNL